MLTSRKSGLISTLVSIALLLTLSGQLDSIVGQALASIPKDFAAKHPFLSFLVGLLAIILTAVSRQVQGDRNFRDLLAGFLRGKDEH